MSWRPKGFKKPYGDEWFVSACQHQYNLGEAYETGFNDCLEALKKEAIHIETVQGWKYLRDSYKDWLHGNRVGYLVFIEED